MSSIAPAVDPGTNELSTPPRPVLAGATRFHYEWERPRRTSHSAHGTMLYIGLVIVAIAALGALVAVHLWFWRVYYRPDESGVDEIHFARTVDGWRLAIHRYAPAVTPVLAPHTGQPVILCHGLGANRFTFDLGHEVSLARWLRKRGWDVWCLELRGIGLSRHPDDSIARHWNWGVEDYLRKDLPAAIEYVCQTTGAPAVHWIGHSLGGTLGFAYLQGRGALRIRSATVVGSPAFLEPTYALQSLVRLHRFFAWLPVLRISAVSRFLAPFYVALRLKLVAINGATIDGNVVRRAMSHLVSDMCGGVLRTLGGWVESGTFGLAGVDFQAGLATIRTPLLVIAGDADPIAPPGECRRIIEAVASEERRFHVLGRRFGASEDYGHGDLLFGREVYAEVFPLLGEWLEARAVDALPPPLPDAVLDHDPETLAAPLRPEPGAPRATDDDEDLHEGALPEPPVHALLPGPFGLLNRYSPFRRRRWFHQRRAFRDQELRDHEALLAGVPRSRSKVSLRATRLRSRQARQGLGLDAPQSPPQAPIEPVPVAPASRTEDPDRDPDAAPAADTEDTREPADPEQVAP